MRASIIIPQAGTARSALTAHCVETLLRAHTEPRVRLSCHIEIVADTVGNLHAAWNRGAAACRGDSLVFLNNDTISMGPWLDALLTRLEEQEHDAIVGVRLRVESHLPREVTQLVGDQFLQGWCFACRRPLWERLRFDEHFALYFGDTDFIARADCPQIAVPAVDGQLIHLGHQSTQLRPDRRAVWARDRATFIRKWS